jgi:PAS domain S-box-containing protein
MAALEAGLISTWIWRVSDNTFWWDEAGEKLWGVDSTQPHTHDIGELLALVHPEDRPSIEAAIAKTVATGIAHGAEFRTLRRDGKLQWLSSRGRVEKDANGNIECVVGAFADITKLKAAEESLRHAQKMQALGTLAGGIAHDFNNLLLAINGNARLALDDVSREHASYRSLQEISKAATRATDLVRRILSFAARQPFAPATTPIMPAVEEALKLLELSMPRNIAVQVRCDDATLACALGAAELQQAIVNLSNNAVHAIGNRDGRIEIDVSSGGALPAELTQPADHYARIEVRDNGCGMDATTRARVFDPFFTTKPTGKGTGLGLAVVHGVVQGCGGAITVASELNRGSTFTLWLPLAGTVTIPALPADAAKRGGGEHILYVDDDEAINFLIQRLLEQLGYRVTCCDDPTHAQRLFAADPHSFDIVVTDLSMPTMSGFDLILALKKIRNDVPTVLTSGYVREDDHARAINLGVDHVILKPNTIDELGHALDALCKRLRARA